MKTWPLWHSGARAVWTISTRKRLVAIALAFVTLMSSSLVAATTASAATDGATGPGISIYPAGYGEVWLGAHRSPAGGDDVLFCTQARVYTSAGDVPLSTGVMAHDPALAWAIGTYKSSGDNYVLAALAYLVHQRHEEPGTMAGGDVAKVKKLISDATPQAVKDLADRFIGEGESQKGPYTAPTAVVDTQTKRNGAIKNVGLLSDSGEWVSGAPFTLTLTGPAVFDTTGTQTLSGVTTNYPQTFTWTATGNGAVTYRMSVSALSRVTLTHYNMAGNRQNGLSYGLRNPSYDPVTTSAPPVVFEAVTDFQPLVSTQVALTRVNKGDVQTDAVSIGAAAGDEWTTIDGRNVDVNVRCTVYGPLDKADPTSMTVPAGAPATDCGMTTFNGPGTKDVTWTPTASGVYAFVAEVRKADQGANAQYIRSDAKDAYFASTETFAVRMAPQISTQVMSRYSDDPDYISQDRVTVSLPAGDVWLADAAGNKLPVRTRITALGCYNTPTAAQAATPANAPVLGTEFLTFTGPGTKTIPAIARSCDGFVTYVAEIRPADQSAAMQAVLAAPVKDWFMLEPETTSARHTIEHYSEMREFNVVLGGRAFDTITIAGMPEDHGTWQGIGGWQADISTATVTIYGPTARRIETATVPAGTPVLTRITIPARNGTYKVGYTDADRINPNLPGNYVAVYSFAGDARVQPFSSPANDIREQFFVPADGQSWFDIMSTATPNAVAGEGVISDTVLATGSAVPAGTMTWQTCVWANPSAPGCAQPTTTFSTPVAGSGFYNHPELPTPTIKDLPPGVLTAYYGWAPVFTDLSGVVMDREAFGTPSQVTTIRARVPDWTSKATKKAGPGDTVSDRVTFDGPTRSDWTTQWYACWLDTEYTCVDGTDFAVGRPVQVDPDVDTLQSPEWEIEIPAGTRPGTQLRLGWQPVLVDGIGAELRREAWGTDGQVTIVDYPLPTMTSQATATALLGTTTQDAVTITGPLEEGSRVVWASCYWIEVEDGSRECRQDATKVADRPVLEDGSLGLVLPALGVGEALTVHSPEHTLTYGGLVPDLGLRFTWQPRIVDPRNAVLAQEMAGVPAQTTVVEFPPITVTTEAYHYGIDDSGPVHGDQIGDRITVEGDILPGDAVTVRLYAWEAGTTPVCTGTPLAEVDLDLQPGQSTYDTGLIYTTDPERPNLTYGFQETTTSRGKPPVVSECGLAAETVVFAAPEAASAHALAVTGLQNLGLLLLAAALIAMGAGSYGYSRDQRQRAVAAGASNAEPDVTSSP